MTSDERASRMRRILRLLGESPVITVQSLTRRLGVSGATVRRDLMCMEDAGLVRRSYGKVTAVRPGSEVPVSFRRSHEAEAKRRIGALAASLVPLGPLTVAIGGGTTAHSVAQCLTARSGLRVVTNSLDIAGSLMARQRVQVVVTGGSARPSSQQLVGDLATTVIRRRRYDVAVVGVDGIGARHGLTAHDADEALVSRAIIEQARRVIVVADSSKLGRRCAQPICGLESVHHVVTDSRASRLELMGIRRQGLSLALAAAPSDL
ncbi:DeoR/GlpR family DNA-binding transcription regulator [Streptomyces sp. PTM05]|uniref:DeoR/GlpR family DNA-binding transcription regulator n=1 Tax=Streptantibioticus parmotrematis TaxID=2873249 RepID=A0ABS7QT26_9ACTN|nr:DeoR/GlpR family DNA-binding transcription regulator [Streptantibioticus parmotrematis]MBY8886342.1 DeoR/GlpR family DNA-binding transcription regulator [Streptantibioticus parmotrematis]